MKEYKLTDWLPTTKKEVELRGWDELDVILFSGDAYVDHPSFGAAVIGRMLEAQGLKVAIIPQPNWRDDLRDFKNWDDHDCFSVFLPDVWIVWSTNIRPTNVCAVKTHILPTDDMTCVRNIQALFILRY